ncbi:acetylcholinesterase [Pseudomassariella vexata]|uniref:Carboxylic ester hydrolase n=1 Tax=Pseudomassariella vexata TaxID=1141098 RepID=A0A1Y2DRP4_9PEZI|nr:acetylcholinesterase [Pseudomassariella vexata]ORY61766.1 acetylcholinesterase [Pseudomassariella vexata]
MLLFTPAAVVVALAGTLIAAKKSCGNSSLSITTENGIVNGFIDPATPGVRRFLGIPYAEPPLGDLRFLPPQPAQPFGTIGSTELPPSCIQFLATAPQLYTREVLEFNLDGLNTTGRISEDCLTLSVWAPLKKHKKEKQSKLPVLIFFYGGSFAMGGQDIPYQIPAQWVQRTQGHIVVTFNFRGNIFGFPNAAGLNDTEQNLGLLDQRLAVEWVRDNIAAFGGDPERIGLWGQSSGAISLGYYSYAYPEDPIANSIMQDSGSEYLGQNMLDPLHTNFTFVAQSVGCGGLGPEEEVACMRTVDAIQIENVLQANPIPILFFGPMVDGRTVFANYTERALQGEIARIPAIVGSNTQDGSVFTPYQPNGFNTTILDLVTLSFFFCSAWQSALTRLSVGLPVYRYEYAGNFSNISPDPWLGAYHESELPLLFGTHPNFRGNSTQLEYETSFAMQDAWLALVAQESVEEQDWPRYSGVPTGLVRQFGNGVAAQNVDRRTMEMQCVTVLQEFS